VIAAANIGMISVVPVGACGIAAAKTVDQPQSSFSESLVSASKAYSETDGASDGKAKAARRQKSAAEDEQATVAVHTDDAAQAPILSHQTVQPQQVVPAQQMQVIPPITPALPLSVGEAATTSDTSIEAAIPSVDAPSDPLLSGLPQSSLVQTGLSPSGLLQSDATQSRNDPSQTASIQSGAETQNTKTLSMPLFEAANSTSSTDANGVAHTAPTVFSNQLPSVAVNAAADSDSNASPNPAEDEAANTTQNVVQSADSASLLQADQAPVLHAALSASARAILASAVTGTPADQVSSTTTGAVQTVPTTDLNVSATTANSLVSQIQTGGGFPGTAHASVSSSNSVPVASQPIAPAANSKEESKDATNNAAGPRQHASLSPDLNVTGGTSDPVASPVSLDGGLPETIHSNVSSFNPVPVANQPVAAAANDKGKSKNTSTDAVELNQDVRVTTDHTSSKTDSQQPAPVGDQTQSIASPQGQSATPSQTNSAANAAVTVFPALEPISTPSSASTRVGVTASAAKSSGATASASAAVTEAAPVINTARLIQSIGQSEMRVGMRSNEFGNISISTSTNKDVISAQISLDHGELAKALAAQLPEMQARLGGNQPMDVRIDMHGTATGQGTGTSGGMSNGASDQSSAGKQQSAYTASSYSDNSVVERQRFPAVAGLTTGYDSLNARLDIRV
jgi:hypothetical protein